MKKQLTTTEIFQKQVAADRTHHAERIEWLTEDCPRYADGVAVNRHEVASMLRESLACLADMSGMRGFNSVAICDRLVVCFEVKNCY